MNPAITDLYEALLQRETDALRSSIDAILAAGPPEKLWLELTRFSLLALAPTEQSQHALLATIDAGSYVSNPRCAAPALAAVAAYLSVSRLPWSEAPILEPVVAGGVANVESIVLAASGGPREIVEQAVEAVMDQRELLLQAAARLDDELRHASIIAGSIQRLVKIHPELRRAGVRAIANCWIAGAGSVHSRLEENSEIRDVATRYVESNGDVAIFHQLLFADVTRHEGDSIAGVPPVEADESLISYNLAKDYAAAFLITPLVSRLASTVEEELRLKVIDAARNNLASGPSFEEWLYV